MVGLTLGLVDYMTCIISLMVSVLIGIYFGCFSKGVERSVGYLQGKNEMNSFLITMSMCTSAISPIALIGIPSEIYVFGTQYAMIIVSTILSIPFVLYFILPVFCNDLGVSTAHEYFELRFGKNVRTMSSLIYLLDLMLFLPVTLYASTIALSELSGIPLLLCTSIVGSACVLYTTIGGYKSVTWADSFQGIITLSACVIMISLGIRNIGSFTRLWRTSNEARRIQLFNLDPSPFVRMTFWNVLLGGPFVFLGHFLCSTTNLQRYLSVKSIKTLKRSIFISTTCFNVIIIITSLMGLCIFAQYHNRSESVNQLFRLFISETIGTIPGLTGLFIAGILSIGLSTLSSELSTAAELICNDFLRPHKEEEAKNTAMKIVAFVIGIILTCTVKIVERYEYTYQLFIMMVNLTASTKVGLLFLGTSFPSVNTKGAIAGMISSIGFCTWLIAGALYKDANSKFVLSTCNINCSIISSDRLVHSDKFSSTNLDNPISYLPHNISFMFCSLLGFLICVFTGNIVSYCTSEGTNLLDSKLTTPIMQQDDGDFQAIIINTNE